MSEAIDELIQFLAGGIVLIIFIVLVVLVCVAFAKGKNDD